MKQIIFSVLILFITISSCTVYKEYAIEVYKPGEIAVPPKVENVALVYRNFKYPGDKYQHHYKDDGRLKNAKNDPANLDSILVSYTLKELASNLKSNNSFDRIHIFPGIFKPHTGKKLPALKFDLIKKITSETETDLLISLETFSYFFAEYSADQGVPKSREVITAAVWAVYNPDTEKIIERKTMIDTVFWNSYETFLCIVANCSKNVFCSIAIRFYQCLKLCGKRRLGQCNKNLDEIRVRQKWKTGN